MDFFKSILAEDLDSPVHDKTQVSEPNSAANPPHKHQHEHDPDHSSPQHDEPASNPDSPDDSGNGRWSFGGLIKTFATRSESVLETYRRDLEEFGSGLKKETTLFREAASRAVKELPSSIEVGASVAHGSLETVSHALDGVLKSTAEIISHGKDTLLAPSDVESDASDSNNYNNQSMNSRRYSRFDAQLRAIQSDENTYREEPEDLDDYNKWKAVFVLEDKSEEVGNLIGENGPMEGIYKTVVPNAADHNTFWCRYFYRVHKLKLQEDMRANLVQRAISIGDEEELSWDVDDEDEDEETNKEYKGENKELVDKNLSQIVKEESSNDKSKVVSSKVDNEEGEDKSGAINVDEGNDKRIDRSCDNVSDEKVQSEQSSKVNNDESVLKSDEKVGLDGKTDHGESCKDSDISVVSTRPSLPEEEDLGWDEIEDLGSSDEKKVTHDGSPNRSDLRKRSTTAEDDDDLSWDIEDDDEPVKKLDIK